MKRFRLKIALDIDDVLYDCNRFALARAGAKTPYEEITKWGVMGNDADKRLEEFEKKDFWENMPLYPGAVDFVRELSKKSDIYFISATEPMFMGIRGKRLQKDFPFIPKENILLGASKYLLNVDVLLDDGAHNITGTDIAFPVLMRRPWNQHMSGCLSVNSYAEFITLIDTILDSYNSKTVDKQPKVYCLVGPSGSGKTSLLKEMVASGLASKVISCTTRKPREGEEDGVDYVFTSKTWFNSHRKEFIETTVYAGEYYGTTYDSVIELLNKGNAITAMDICGAIALKRAFPGQIETLYIDRDKTDLILSILNRDIANEEKMKRIISLSDEIKNMEICDSIIDNSGSFESAVEQLRSYIRNRSK